MQVKKITASILSLCLLTSGLSSVHAAEKVISVSLNGESIQFHSVNYNLLVLL